MLRIFLCCGFLGILGGIFAKFGDGSVDDRIAATIVGGHEGPPTEREDLGPWVPHSECQLVDGACMGPAYPCSGHMLANCAPGSLGHELPGGPNQACQIVFGPGSANKQCRNQNYNIGELQTPCARYYHCGWVAGLGCVNVPGFNQPALPASVVAPKSCEDGVI